jgi:glycosyltransferase involved in cell wall biosynthesis
MKVLAANNYFYLRGGCERVLFNDIEALTAQGVDVIPFSAADPANRQTPYARYFVPGADIRATSLVKKIGAALDAVHCRRTADAFDRMLDETAPDVVHCHNVYGRLSTSILKVARRRSIPIVMTVHDYKVVCPSYLMLKNGKPCTACLDGGYYRCATNRCHKGQSAASMVYAIEAYYSRLSGSYDAVSAFLCPSQFTADLLRRAGIASDRIVYHPNAVAADACPPSFQGDYVLSVGRLSHEKGLPTFVRAMLGAKIPVRIAGTGPVEQELRTLAQADRDLIVFEGDCQGDRLATLYRNAAFVVVPSEWYENAPMSILESFAYGKPVIGTRIGGIPELIVEGVHGTLVEPGNVGELRTAIIRLWNDRHAQAVMGGKARELVETRFSQQSRTNSLIRIYNSLTGSSEFEAIRSAPSYAIPVGKS